MLGHINNVKRFASRVAREMGHDPYEIAVLRYAVITHDISKFLNEMRWLFFGLEGPFSLEQRKKAKQHAYLSASTLQIFWKRFVPHHEMVLPVAIIVAGHHWCYSESEECYRELIATPQFKYPSDRGADLGDFPLDGIRILQVVDSFFGNVEQRHYKDGPSPTPAEAYHELVSKPSEYDPKVVQVFGQILAKSSSKVLCL
jgi:HD-GYP domain-containing protein (c-di-GMP phosphodiesterase class II)